MNKVCYVDKNIVLSNANIELLNRRKVSIVYFDCSDDKFNFSEIKYLLLHSSLSIDKLELMTKCKYIGIRAHNTDYVNKEISDSYNIKLVGLKKQHGSAAVAEHTFALIFALSKNLLNSHKNIVNGNWKDKLPWNIELIGKTLAVVGNGMIGKRVAEIASLFGLKVFIIGRDGNLRTDEVSLDVGLSEADIITIHISSNIENTNFIDEEKFQLMKNNSIFINTSRGSVVDYNALDKEIQNGKFLGVGLDVFPEEPIKNCSLFHYPNVICTPHLGYLTKECIERMNNELVDNLLEEFNCS